MERELTSRPPAGTFASQPTSRPGRWARIALVVSVATFFLASMLTGIFGRREAGSAVDDVMQASGPVFGVLLVGAGIVSLACALLALVRHRERSFVVWAALAWGILAVVFLLAELLLPH